MNEQERSDADQSRPLLLRLPAVELVHSRLVNLRALPPGERRLGAVGYAGLAAMLAATVVIAVAGPHLPQLTFRVDDGEIASLRAAPDAAIVLSSMGLALGWGLVLTGATDCSRRVHIPIALVFLGVMLVLAADLDEALGDAGTLAVMPALLLTVVVILSRLRRRPWAWLVDHPVPEFIVWTGCILAAVATGWFSASGRVGLAEGMETALGALAVLALPFWIILALEVVDRSAAVGRRSAAGVESVLTQRSLRRIAATAVAVHPLVAVALLFADEAYALGLLASLIVAAALLVTLARRRWTTRAARAYLAVTVATPLIATFIVLGTQQGSENVAELFLASSGLPPLVLFAGLTTLDVLNLGAKFSSGDGRLLPRSGRLLLYTGAVILVTAASVFFLSSESLATPPQPNFLEAFFSDIFIASLYIFALPWLAIQLWRARQAPDTDQSRPEPEGDTMAE